MGELVFINHRSFWCNSPTVFNRIVKQVKVFFIGVAAHQEADTLWLPPSLDDLLDVIALTVPMEGLWPFGIGSPGVALHLWPHAVAEESSLSLNCPVCPEIFTL